MTNRNAGVTQGGYNSRRSRLIRADAPFVLLDDARVSGAVPARLYSAPIAIVTAHIDEQMPLLFDQLRRAHAKGQHIAGYIGYPDAKTPTEGNAAPKAWFGIFEGYREIDPDLVLAALPDPDGAYLSGFRPDITRDQYAAAFAKVQEFIVAGDIYQANLTFRAFAHYAGDPLALYAAMRLRSSAGYGGIVWDGSHYQLSFSPELFFAAKSGRVTTKPMKGTAARSANPHIDADHARELQSDPKQRAENLMIVDLLRNDLSQVCAPGSVEVPQLFQIESYPTVHQMTSTVTGHLREDHDAIDLIAAIFPCGSITGAPKIRAMEIIDAVESSPRGVYCGSIGRIDPNGDAAFNVAIRTLTIKADQNPLYDAPNTVSLGLGSGIVADSDEADEWAECLAKGAFARVPGYGFDLIETMRFDPEHGIARLELHLERIKTSARVLDYEFDRHAARNQLHAVTFHLDEPAKIRLSSARSGAIAIELAAMPAPAERIWQIGILPLPVPGRDFRLRHKTSDRGFYDEARCLRPDCDEVVFVDPDGYLTEGSFTSLFVRRGDQWITPPLMRGLLPSVLRAEMLASGEAVEADLTPGDILNEFCVGNSLRGLIPAKAVA
jgi:para-aminobenzoate synthetase / 4-amino-4-deoxychorismate lyase